MDVLIYGISIGIMLSFMAGTVFFLLIETTILKGIRAAMVLDLGIILSDLVYIFLAYYGSKEFIGNIADRPYIYFAGGGIVLAYGLYSFYNKKSILKPKTVKLNQNYFKLFFKGFVLNIINIGVLFFWIGVVISVGTKFDFDSTKTFTALLIIMSTYFAIDLIKIYLFSRIREKLNLRRMLIIKKIIAIILIFIGLFFIKQGITNIIS